MRQELADLRLQHHLQLGEKAVSPLCFEAGLMQDLSAYVAAYAPSAWQQACEETTVPRQGETRGAYLAPYFYDQSNVVLGALGFQHRRGEEGVSDKAAARIGGLYRDVDETLDPAYLQPLGTSRHTPIIRYLTDINALSSLLFASKTLDILASAAAIDPSSDLHPEQNMARALAANIVVILAGRQPILTRAFMLKMTNVRSGDSIAGRRQADQAQAEQIQREYAEFQQLSIQFASTFELSLKIADYAARVEGQVNASMAGQSGETEATSVAVVKTVEHKEEQVDFDQLLARAEAFGVRISAQNEPWLITGKEIRHRGLSDALGDLVRGYEVAGGQSVSGRSKTEAQMTIGIVEHMREIAEQCKGIEAFESYYIESLAADEASLVEALSLLNTEAAALSAQQQAELRLKIPDLLHSQQLLQTIREDWSGLELLIRKYWQDGAQVANGIHRLLFPADKPIAEQPATVADAQEITRVEESRDAKLTLTNIAEQLDEIILPPDASSADIEKAVRQLASSSEAEMSVIDWQRLHNLVRLRDEFGGRLYRSKKGSLGYAPPYYVVVLQAAGETYAVAECPVEGNATYVVAERLIGDNWLTALSQTKQDARIYGADRIIHRKGLTTPDHLEKIRTLLMDLMTVTPKPIKQKQ